MSEILTENDDDEIDIVQHALLFCYAAAIFADETHRMRLIHLYRSEPR